MNTTKINTPLEYGFFNCADGTEDRVYTAENFTGYLSAIICDGILDTWGDCFSLSYSDTSLTIGTGMRGSADIMRFLHSPRSLTYLLMQTRACHA